MDITKKTAWKFIRQKCTMDRTKIVKWCKASKAASKKCKMLWRKSNRISKRKQRAAGKSLLIMYSAEPAIMHFRHDTDAATQGKFS